MADSADKDRVKGKAKEATGAVTGDDSMRREGRGDQGAADAKDKVNSAVDKVKNVFRGK